MGKLLQMGKLRLGEMSERLSDTAGKRSFQEWEAGMQPLIPGLFAVEKADCHRSPGWGFCSEDTRL